MFKYLNDILGKVAKKDYKFGNRLETNFKDYVNLNKDAQDFLKWIVTEGQKYNHNQGFLMVDSSQKDNLKKQIDYASLQENK